MFETVREALAELPLEPRLSSALTVHVTMSLCLKALAVSVGPVPTLLPFTFQVRDEASPLPSASLKV